MIKGQKLYKGLILADLKIVDSYYDDKGSVKKTYKVLVQWIEDGETK